MKNRLNVPFHEQIGEPTQREGPDDARTELTDEDDIRTMVHAFYARVEEDDELGPIFQDVAEVNWETHLPKMVRFWSNLLFQTGAYRGRPFHAHKPLPIQSHHFERWLTLFWKTVDEHFYGEKAHEAKLMAAKIGNGFAVRLSQKENKE